MNASAAPAISFAAWCDHSSHTVKTHGLTILTVADANFETGCKRTAEVVPIHYASQERVADILEKLGKVAAATYLGTKLPTLPSIRSGDLAEILATEYILEHTTYRVPIRRLRWKDHRNMSLRGDDVIGVAVIGQSVSYLKSEVKSRRSLSSTVVDSARTALESDEGLPSPHALAYVADRLREMGQEDLANRITKSQLIDGIVTAQVEHLLFTFSGNTPESLLKASLNTYAGPNRQHAVGLHTLKHQEFIAAVYKFVEDGN
jgi:hypothetical protein